MDELRKEGHTPSYKWKSIHIEAELVRDGLEEKQREPSRARRSRISIPACQRTAAGCSSLNAKPSPVDYSMPYHHDQSPEVMPEVTTGLKHNPFQQYEYQQRHQSYAGCDLRPKILPGMSHNNIQAEQLNAQPQPPLIDEHHEQLISECLDRTVFDTGSKHLAIAALELLDDSQQQRQ